MSHLFLALDVATFQSPVAFRGGLSRFLALVREQPAVEGSGHWPGDPEVALAALRRLEGIPLEDAELAAFERIDREVDRYARTLEG